LSIVEADGAEFIANTEKGIDALLVDAFDRTGFAPALANREFFENAYAKLSGNGVLVINLAGDKESYAGLIGGGDDVFDDQVIVISVPDVGNHICSPSRNAASSALALAEQPREGTARPLGLDFRPSCRRWSVRASSASPAARRCAGAEPYLSSPARSADCCTWRLA
jgi:hypothetical protein